MDRIVYPDKNTMQYFTRKTEYNSQPKGFVLITVLLIVVLLTAVLLQFNYATTSALQRSDTYTHQLEALYAARSTLNIALAVIDRNPDITTNQTLYHMLQQPKTFRLEKATCSLKLQRENGKININALLGPRGQFDRFHVDQLLRLIDLVNRKNPDQPPLSYQIVPALIDWLDKDEQVTVLPFIKGTNRGAESNYYRQKSPPYHCPNIPMQNLAEIRLIKGFTTIKSTSAVKSAPDLSLWQQLTHYLTVYGSGKIDLNTAPPLVIQSLSENISPEIARLIVDYRRNKPFADITDLAAVQGLGNINLTALQSLMTVAPQNQFYTITAQATVNNCRAIVKATVRKYIHGTKIDILSYQEN